LIAPVFLLAKFVDPATTAGLGPRWRTFLGDGKYGRMTLSRRTGRAVLTVSFLIDPAFAAPLDLSKLG
jgi:hypothetical protein